MLYTHDLTADHSALLYSYYYFYYYFYYFCCGNSGQKFYCNDVDGKSCNSFKITLHWNRNFSKFEFIAGYFIENFSLQVVQRRCRNIVFLAPGTYRKATAATGTDFVEPLCHFTIGIDDLQTVIHIVTHSNSV